MSCTIETIIACDGCSDNCNGDDRRMTAKRIRATRKDQGWRYVGGKDWCPECWRVRNATPTRKETRT